MNAPQIHLT